MAINLSNNNPAVLPEDITQTGPSPSITLTDNTASAKDAILVVDNDALQIKELAGASASGLLLDLVNNRLGVGLAVASIGAPTVPVHVGVSGNNGQGIRAQGTIGDFGIGLNAGGAGYAGALFNQGTINASIINRGMALGSFAAANNPAADTLIVDKAGIGTATPSATFEVVGNATIARSTGAANALLIDNSAGAGSSYGLQVRAGGNTADHSFSVQDRSAASTYFHVRGDGNVGVGTISPNTTLHVNGGASIKLSAKTAAYTMLTSDFAVTGDATTAAFTVTLPPATNTGMLVHIKKVDASVNAVTVSRAGTDTIEGATTQTLATQYASTTLIADGVSKWLKLAVI